MKLQRSGFTETNLIFINSLKNPNKDLLDLQNTDIQRMYSKAGFYDKSIKGTYFDIDVSSAKNSENFSRWLREYEYSLINSDYLEIMSHIKKDEIYKDYRPVLSNYVDTLHHKNEINKSFFNYWVRPYSFYDLLNNKKVLILNSFASLIQRQYESGNTHRIFSEFPVFSNLYCIDFPYTFFNNGPHSNFFETLDYYFDLLKNKDFDVALISCGPYGCIIVDKIVRTLQKDALTMGSGITPMFGIQPQKCEPNWICEIPPEYIPQGYQKIEKGRYWIGK